MFRMTVQDVFVIRGRGRGRGRVATGRVESGRLWVDGIEAFRKVLDEAVAGDNVGPLFSGLERSDLPQEMSSPLARALM